jgi:drug/metabolite transporter (DMT)-like permease
MPLRHDPRRGAILMLGAGAVFALMSALVKELAPRHHFLELMFFRTALAMPVIWLIVWRSGARAPWRTKRPWGHGLRAMTGSLGMGLSFYALMLLPLAEHTALTHTTPLFITLLSIPFLGERVGLWRGGAVALGFAGILVVALGAGAFAGGALATAGIVAAVAHGVASAVTTLLVRTLSATESSATIVLWQSALMSLITACALPFVWTTPSGTDWLFLVAIGLCGACGQWLMTEAWASAEVSSVAPFSFASILWATLFGILLFGDWPGLATLAGAALIVAGGIAILRGEFRGRHK